ncbi:phage head closure protein [Duganella sp. FT94W]|uniref:Phage head closure protein n=1 Tax=Duganella lactea TaxID=2692173 RepID=A0ABW9VCA2_9BURK|nr:phage head closure protein [Duganella lactea]MYM37258.1 phage head closure protein [Duganella lactea]
MSALKYNQRIRIEKPGGRDPRYGAATKEWLPVIEVWAKVEDTKPKNTDATQGGLRLARDAATVWVRYREGITSDMRVVELDGRRRVLSITGGPSAVNGYRDLEFTVERYSV